MIKPSARHATPKNSPAFHLDGGLGMAFSLTAGRDTGHSEYIYTAQTFVSKIFSAILCVTHMLGLTDR